MAVDVPVTLWRPTGGNSEMGSGATALLTTLAGVQLTTLGAVNLITLDGSYTMIPASVWSEDDSV